MHSENKIERPDDDNKAQNNNGDDLSRPRPQWLPRWLFNALGPIALLVIVFGGAAAYYAYHYVTEDSVRFPFWVSFMFSFLAFVVLLVQSVIYAQQADFMKEQVRSSNQLIELMAISECAYIRVGDLKLPQPIRNNRLFVEGKFFNGGRTPAWNFQRQIQIAFATPAPPPPDWGVNWGNSTEESPISMIVAGGSVDFGMGIDVTADSLKKINSDEMVILLDGERRYLDSLGGKIVYRFGYTFELAPPKAVERYQTHYREKANPN